MAELPDFTLHLLSRITPERRAELEALVPAGRQDGLPQWCDRRRIRRPASAHTALVSLSRAEGYGLPLVEAMSLGTPVIASDIPIFREVGGDAVAYVHPDSPRSLPRPCSKLGRPALCRTFAPFSGAGRRVQLGRICLAAG